MHLASLSDWSDKFGLEILFGIVIVTVTENWLGILVIQFLRNSVTFWINQVWMRLADCFPKAHHILHCYRTDQNSQTQVLLSTALISIRITVTYLKRDPLH